MKVLHTIRDVPSNREGLCALSSSNDNSYLAYPGSSITGEIQIFDTLNLVDWSLKNKKNILYFVFSLVQKPGIMISAHESPLAAMAFDMSGTKLATASNKVHRLSHLNVRENCQFWFPGNGHSCS